MSNNIKLCENRFQNRTHPFFIRNPYEKTTHQKKHRVKRPYEYKKKSRAIYRFHWLLERLATIITTQSGIWGRDQNLITFNKRASCTSYKYLICNFSWYDEHAGNEKLILHKLMIKICGLIY